MDKRTWRLLGGLCLCPCLPACGPGELPAFANPPPDDAGTHTRDGEDAGSLDAGTRLVDVADAAAE
jgi:hypothetical protein